jgi:hypothetical protein
MNLCVFASNFFMCGIPSHEFLAPPLITLARVTVIIPQRNTLVLLGMGEYEVN